MEKTLVYYAHMVIAARRAMQSPLPYAPRAVKSPKGASISAALVAEIVERNPSPLPAEPRTSLLGCIKFLPLGSTIR